MTNKNAVRHGLCSCSSVGEERCLVPHKFLKQVDKLRTNTTTKNDVRHTPGPWTARFERTRWHIELLRNDGPSLEVCQIDKNTRDKHTDEANAHLIASAPEMLFHLKRFCCSLKPFSKDREEIENLIDKAEGRG